MRVVCVCVCVCVCVFVGAVCRVPCVSVSLPPYLPTSESIERSKLPGPLAVSRIAADTGALVFLAIVMHDPLVPLVVVEIVPLEG